MYLKKLEIAGFKSFANKTVLDFMPTCSFSGDKKNNGCGITAIVGPNGSGKSNIADAILWTMGEQSMKKLRGKKSEDIIFVGSGKKSGLSYATASLYFDNSDKRIPLDFEEVVITRKFFRNGDSEYLINGSRTRLIDVVDILAKAGIGKDSYSVINQGMSDAILNATPLERKTIIEDAAGVKQYQIKKNRALRKLETTAKNLEQVKGLINEIEPHLRILKRQANKAQKGAIVRAELKRKQEELYAYLWHKFQEDRDNSYVQKESFGREMMQKQKEVDKLNDDLNLKSKNIQNFKEDDKLKEQKNNLYSKINILEKEQTIIEGRIEILQERQEQENQIKSILVDTKYIQEKLVEIKEQQAEIAKQIQRAKTVEDIKGLKEISELVGREIDNLNKDIDKGEVVGEKSKEQIAREEKIIAEIKKAEDGKEKIRQNIKEIKLKIDKAEQQIKEEAERIKREREWFFNLEEKVRQQQQELSVLKDKFNDAKISLARIEVREEDLIIDIKENLKISVEELKYNGQKVDKYLLEKEIAKLKMQKEQIGGIDPIIVKEYEETEERHQTLSRESEDLEKAIESLVKVAKEMDEKVEKSFKNAFSEINQEFSKYFRIIFGGGKARMNKLKIASRKVKAEKDEDEDGEFENDIKNEKKTEVGVDIYANPPGKKISNLAMLSGGERALTSLALLFAIISYNPPPFAILDEVEAALDEANSRRFSKILQKLSGNTQFVAITHNRETMRQATLLYGVTMGDDGISKLLSVKLENSDN